MLSKYHLKLLQPNFSRSILRSVTSPKASWRQTWQMTVQHDYFIFTFLPWHAKKKQNSDISYSNENFKWERCRCSHHQTAVVSDEVFIIYQWPEMEYNSTIYGPLRYTKCSSFQTIAPPQTNRTSNSQTGYMCQFYKSLRVCAQTVRACVNTFMHTKLHMHTSRW